MTEPIDLRSDTVTKPVPGMRRAMADAEVGDDVLDGDPTTRRLEERVAAMLGTERALFFPTGTMANQAGLWALSQPGTEVLAHEDSHIVNWEMAGAAALAGVQPRLIRGAPRITLETLAAAQRAPSRDAPRTSLLCLENTHNGAGGMVTPVDELAAIAAQGRALGLAVLLDGARLWNANVATGTPLPAFAALADATMVSFSKGLGAPVGAALAGSADVIERAWEARKRFGGGMRQSGVLAAAALYGLDHHYDRLGDDHANAARFAAIVGEAAHARVVRPDTNIVMIDLAGGRDSADVARAAAARGVKVSIWLPTRVRAVMHLDVTPAQVERAAMVLRDVLS
ncbi:MAG: threonine aldolase family protein [Gemmatimonadetes bacterium]|nr:threonine aldolase family protein [Gemmatimonadota bacterium]